MQAAVGKDDAATSKRLLSALKVRNQQLWKRSNGLLGLEIHVQSVHSTEISRMFPLKNMFSVLTTFFHLLIVHSNLQLEMTKLPALPPLYQPSANAQQQLVLARKSHILFQ
jgi:hypothetical protein